MMKKNYFAPDCSIIEISTETLIAQSRGENLMVGGKDTDNGTTKTNGYTYGDVKANTVDWDE